MTIITLENQAENGESLQAQFALSQGMNLLSYKKGSVEIIDQSTKDLFDERSAGLGALIGPHFHRRKKEVIPKIANEELFPHIAKVRAKGIEDPFSHGIGRYAPWTLISQSANHVHAQLTGKDLWNDVALSTLEGQNFSMSFNAKLEKNGLFLNLSIVSETDSLIGIHYYYALPNGRGRILSQIRGENGEVMQLNCELNEFIDQTYHPFPDLLTQTIVLETDQYQLKTTYQSPSAENCWQLYHPNNASFVCIEPISAKNPKYPNLSVSALQIQLEILDL